MTYSVVQTVESAQAYRKKTPFTQTGQSAPRTQTGQSAPRTQTGQSAPRGGAIFSQTLMSRGRTRRLMRSIPPIGSINAFQAGRTRKRS